MNISDEQLARLVDSFTNPDMRVYDVTGIDGRNKRYRYCVRALNIVDAATKADKMKNLLPLEKVISISIQE